MGKRPVSSSSLACGFTSASANSRTVRCSSRCSLVSSRCNSMLPIETRAVFLAAQLYFASQPLPRRY